MYSINREKIISFLFLTGVVLMPLQNINFPYLGSGFFYTQFSLPIFLLCSILLIFAKAPFFYSNKLLLFIVGYTLLVTILGVYQYRDSVSSISLPLKAVKEGALWWLFLACSFFMYRVDENRFALCVKAAFIVALIGLLVLDHLNFFNDLSFLAIENENSRPRSFLRESSHLSFFVLSVGVLCCAQSNSKLEMLFWCSAIIFALFLARSKGGIIIFIITPIIVSFLSGRRIWLFASIVVSILFTILVYDELYTLIASDLKSYSSIATRLSSFLSTLIVLVKYPLGVGLGGWLPAFTDEISNSLSFFYAIGLDLNFTEILSYTTLNDDDNISPKNTLLYSALIWGFLGVSIYAWIHIKLWKRSSGYWEKILVVILFLSGSTYVTSHQLAYTVACYYFLWHGLRKREI